MGPGTKPPIQEPLVQEKTPKSEHVLLISLIESCYVIRMLFPLLLNLLFHFLKCWLKMHFKT